VAADEPVEGEDEEVEGQDGPVHDGHEEVVAVDLLNRTTTARIS